MNGCGSLARWMDGWNTTNSITFWGSLWLHFVLSVSRLCCFVFHRSIPRIFFFLFYTSGHHHQQSSSPPSHNHHRCRRHRHYHHHSHHQIITIINNIIVVSCSSNIGDSFSNSNITARALALAISIQSGQQAFSLYSRWRVSRNP